MSDIAVGIDLGASYSCVAVSQGGVPRVLSSEWGDRTQASVVSFLDDGTVLVGNEAKRSAVTDAENTVYAAKRLIGLFYFSDEVKKARAVMPYKIVEGPSNSVRIGVRDTTFAVPELSALVLKKMKAIAENALGRPVTKAVVACPAHFKDNQRRATEDAARIAGLEVLGIVDEPGAAALAYGFGRDISRKICVYDIGGGSFDVSILEVGRDVFEVLSTAGDACLGGDDLDDRIMTWLADDFLERHGLDLRQNGYCLQKLKEAGERAKIEVGREGAARIHVPGICRSPEGEVIDLAQDLGADQFNRMVTEVVQRTFKACDEALQSARMTAADVDEVILVGGSTRLPVIRDSVRHYFQKDPKTDVDPDEVVALGAAIRAAALLEEGQANVGPQQKHFLKP